VSRVRLTRLRGAHGVGAAVAGAVLLAASTPGAASRSTSVSPSRDGPIPGFSGGFGESSCTACHFDGELNEAPGSLVLAGVPDRYRPGEGYALTLTLTRPGIAVGGFQLTARFEEGGAQAGSLKPAREDGRITVTPDRGVQYAHHLRPGTDPTVRDTARWELVWTAPPSVGAVLVHAAANAADGDDSQLGDRIYTTVAASRPGG
jgi:hypothetical protein